jgi:hypothetical protein
MERRPQQHMGRIERRLLLDGEGCYISRYDEEGQTDYWAWNRITGGNWFAIPENAMLWIAEAMQD